MTYRDIMKVTGLVEHLKDTGAISESLYQTSVERMKRVSEIMVIDNDLVIIDDAQMRTMPQDTPLGEESYEALQEFIRWLMDQNPAFKEHFELA